MIMRIINDKIKMSTGSVRLNAIMCQLPMLLSLLFASLVMGACGGDDDNEPSLGYNVTTVEALPSWQIDWSSNDARPAWKAPNPNEYENWSVIMIQIEDALMPYVGAGDMIALFVGDELRGLANTAFLGESGGSAKGVFLLKAFGNEPDKKEVDVSLSYYCNKLKQIFSLSGQAVYKTGEVFGVDDDYVPQFTHGSSKYPVVMNLGVTVTSLIQSSVTPSEGDVIAAFVGDECRGIYTLDNALLSSPVSMDVYGRATNEAVTLKYYSARNNSVFSFFKTVNMCNGTTSVSL